MRDNLTSVIGQVRQKILAGVNELSASRESAIEISLRDNQGDALQGVVPLASRRILVDDGRDSRGWSVTEPDMPSIRTFRIGENVNYHRWMGNF